MFVTPVLQAERGMGRTWTDIEPGPDKGVNRLQSSHRKMADSSNFEKSNLESMGIFDFKYELLLISRKPWQNPCGYWLF